MRYTHPFNKLYEFCELVKLEHSIFALPFTMSCALLAADSKFPAWQTIIWIILAMVGARTAAMAINRIVDRHIDKLNKRTENRGIPAGRVKISEAWIIVMISLLLLVFAVSNLPSLCFYLLPLVFLLIGIYSFTKRFSYFSHLVLGFTLGCAAVGGWLAVMPVFHLTPILWGLAVTFWVAGFDIIYACQDYNFDKQYRLHSIPAQFGIEKALIVSRFFHLITVLCIYMAGIYWQVGYLYYGGVVFTAGMLLYEHTLISPQDLSKINAAFFTMNGYVSIGLFIFIVLDKVLL